MFPSETTESTGTRVKLVDNEKTGDFVFPTEYKESTVSRIIVLKNAKTRDFIASKKSAVSTESTTIKQIPDKRIETVDFIFPPDLTSSRLADYKNDKLLDNRISLACSLALCWGKKWIILTIFKNKNHRHKELNPNMQNHSLNGQ